MGLNGRSRNIALTQLNALKERLDRIDYELEPEPSSQRAKGDAIRELEDPTDIRPSRRTPEEIASGSPVTTPRQTLQPSSASSTSTGPLAVHYRILGLDEGSDLSAVDAAYQKLMARCAPERFPEGSQEQQSAKEIMKRVESAYNALRDALDPTAGRFDKLEFE